MYVVLGRSVSIFGRVVFMVRGYRLFLPKIMRRGLLGLWRRGCFPVVMDWKYRGIGNQQSLTESQQSLIGKR